MEKITADQLKAKNTGNFTLVDVYADWCQPCKRMTPVLETLSEEFITLDFVKVDADADHQYSADVGVRSIPTLIIYDLELREVERWTGNQDINSIREWITGAISK